MKYRKELPGVRYYDNTRVSEFKTCPRKYFLRHICDIRPDTPSMPLIFGSCWHEAMDALWLGICTDQRDNEAVIESAYRAFMQCWTEEYGLDAPADADPAWLQRIAPRTPDTALNMLIEYVDTRRGILEQMELLDVERPFVVPLETPHSLPTETVDGEDLLSNIMYIGKLDKVVRWQGSIHVVEHKTTTMYKKDGPFRTGWINSFSPNSQVDGYLYAANMIYDEPVKGVLIDGALVHKTVHNGFRFIPVDKDPRQVGAWMYEAGYFIEQIDEHRIKLAEWMQERNANPEAPDPFLEAFPRVTSSCSHYDGCPYQAVCKVLINPGEVLKRDASVAPGLGFVEDHWSPFEKMGMAELGLPSEE